MKFICILSSGERSIGQHLTSVKITLKGGQAVRVVDIPVSGQFGIFDCLHNFSAGNEFADYLRETGAKFYGNAGPCFVEHLIHHLPSLDLELRLSTILDRFGKDLSAQSQRIARVFALAALAGELASEWGITGWEKETATAGVIKVFEKWKEEQRGEAKNREYTQILSRIRDFIDKHGDSRFSDVDWTAPDPNKFNQGPPSVRDRAGYWKNTEYSKFYLFSSAGLQDAGGDFEMNRILKALKEAGAFAKTGADKKAITTRVPSGGTAALYWIDPEKL